MGGLKWVGCSAIGGLVYSLIVHGGWTTPALEWTVVFIYLNYFGVLALTNEFYSSIHAYGTLVTKQ
jgi:hypothetical protein